MKNTTDKLRAVGSSRLVLAWRWVKARLPKLPPHRPLDYRPVCCPNCRCARPRWFTIHERYKVYHCFKCGCGGGFIECAGPKTCRKRLEFAIGEEMYRRGMKCPEEAGMPRDTRMQRCEREKTLLRRWGWLEASCQNPMMSHGASDPKKL